MDEVMEELAAIRREKQLLQLPAYLWERYAPKCNGECKEPKPVAVDVGGSFVLDCCSFHIAFRQFCLLRGLEATLRQRLKEAA
jgi:hypothetical protein